MRWWLVQDRSGSRVMVADAYTWNEDGSVTFLCSGTVEQVAPGWTRIVRLGKPMSQADAAHLLGVTSRTIRRWVNAGRVQTTDGGKVWLEQCEVAANRARVSVGPEIRSAGSVASERLDGLS